MFSSPIASYKQMEVESDVHGADPHYLIVLLFNGLEAALKQALACLEAGDIEGKNKYLSQSIDLIVNGLSSSLDIERGGDLAEKLQALYTYMVSRLVHANIHLDVGAIREVQKLVDEIGGAWRDLGGHNKERHL